MNRKTKDPWGDFGILFNIISLTIAVVGLVFTTAVLFFGDTLFGRSSDLRYFLSSTMHTDYGTSRCVFLVNRGQLTANDVQVIVTIPDLDATDLYYDKESFKSEPNIKEDKAIGRTTFSFSELSRGEEGVFCLGFASDSIDQEPEVVVRYDDQQATEGVYKRSRQENMLFQILGIVAFTSCPLCLILLVLNRKR